MYYLTGNGSGQKGFSCARRTIQKTSLGRGDANSLEQLGVEKGQFDNFSKFANLFTETSDFGVRHISGVFVGHVVDERVNLAR